MGIPKLHNCFLLLLLLICQVGFAQDNLRVLVLSGTQAADNPAGVNYESLSAGSINDRGDIAFSARLDDTTSTGTSDVAIFSGSTSGEFRLRAQTGTLMDGRRFAPSVFGGVRTLRNGDLRFGASIDSFGATIIFSETDGVSVLARQTDPFPTLGPGSFLLAIHGLRINDNGQSAISSRVSLPVGNTGFTNLIYDGTSQEIILIDDDEIPGSNELTFGSSSMISMSEQGKLIFRSSISGPRVDSSNNVAVFSFENSQFTQIIRSGSRVPDINEIANFSNPQPNPTAFLSITTNKSGELAFIGRFSGVSIDESNNEGIFFQNETGQFSLLIREGDVIGEVAPNETFGSLVTSPQVPNTSTNPRVYRSQNHLAFFSTIRGSGVDRANDEALFLADEVGNLSLVAREGDSITLDDTGLFFDTFSDINSVTLNDAGQFVFVTNLKNSAGTRVGKGLFATDLLGQLQLVAVEGDTLDVNDDPTMEELKTIDVLQSGSASGFNSNGQLVFKTLFTDNSSAIFLFNGVRSLLLGDVDLDGTVSFLDISPFISILSSGGFQDEADIDQNGVVNFLDISPFIGLLSGV